MKDKRYIAFKQLFEIVIQLLYSCTDSSVVALKP